MKRSGTLIVFGTCALLLVFTLGIATQDGATPQQAANASAAFRDGVFQARLAAQRGEKPHLTTGRWSTDAGRREFVAGYQQGYLEALGQDGITVPQGEEQVAYIHGLADGAQDRQSGQSFRDVVRKGDRTGVLPDVVYRNAYATGYQLSYYGEQQLQNALVIRPVVSQSY